MLIAKRLLATVIIAWGVLALLVRSLTPLVEDLRPEIQRLVSDQLNTPVTIDTVAARWYGFRPLIELRGIQVGPPGEELSISKAALELAPLGWLGQLGGGDRAALLDGLKLTLEGLALTVAREPDGRFHVEGYGFIGSSDAPPLPRRMDLVDTRLRWIDRQRGAAPIDLTDISIRLVRDGENLDLRARLTTPAGTADAMARLDGYLGTVDWSGDSYLRLGNLDVARLLRPYLPARYGFRSLALNLEAWTRWSAALPVHTQGEVSLRDLSLRPTFDGAGALEIDAASSNFSIARDLDRQLLIGLRRLRLAMPDGIWPESGLALRVAKADDTWALDLYADYLDLEDTSRIAAVRPVNGQMREAIEALRPRGELEKLRLRLDAAEDALNWQIASRFRGLGFDTWRGSPAVEGLDGELLGKTGDIRINLLSSDTRVTFETLFRDPLQFDRLAGELAVVVHESGWSASTGDLEANAPDLSTRSRFFVRQHTDEPLFLDLQTDFADGDASAASLYYPAHIMNPALVSWLDRSIVEGRIVTGSALFHGTVDDFAFEKTRSGAFEVLFDLADATLNYTPGWPSIKGLTASLHFHGNQLDIVSSAGRIYDSRVEELTARIASLNPAAPVEIKGRLAGPLQDNLRVLQEDALRERLGVFAEGLDAQGDTRLDLDFTVPLGEQGKSTLDGTLYFSGNQLAMSGWGLALDGIEGALSFDMDGVSAKAISARGLGSTLSIDVDEGDPGITRIQATGPIRIDAIEKQWPAVPLWFASGEADFTIAIDVPAQLGIGDAQRLMHIESGLQGVAIDLPAPLGKPEQTRKTLTVQLPLEAGPATGILRYGDSLAARFDAAGDRMAIAFGDVVPPLPDGAGLQLSGELAELDLATWQTRLSTAPDAATSTLPEISGQVRIARLPGLPMPANAVDVQVRQRAGDWQLELEGPQISGTIEVPADLDAEPLSANLQRLILEIPLADSETPKPPPAPGSAMDPTALPGVALAVEDFQVNAARLGRLAAIARPVANGWELRELSVEGETETLEAAGLWQRSDSGITTSRLEGSLETAGLGDLMVDLGYTRQVEGAPGRVGFTLNWAGDPTQAHHSTLQGELSIALEEGRMVELDPGVTRVVGLFNLNALTRRLRLDFSDLFKRGYSFDTIDGIFLFDEGTAVTEGLSVVGPAGQIEISGTTNLAERTLDHEVDVTPKLDATLPIAGAIAGGPVAGLAVFVAQKLVSDQVDDLNRFEYEVKGSWADPEITQLDSGGALSKLLKPLSGSTKTEPDDIASDEQRAPPAPIPTTEALSGQETPQPEDGEGGGTGNPLSGLLDLLKQGEVDAANSPLDQD